MLVEKCEMAIWKKAGLSNHPVPEGKNNDIAMDFLKFLGSEEGQRLEGESGVAIPAYNGWGYLMIAPTIIGLIVLNVYPFIDTIILNFCKSGVFGGRIFPPNAAFLESPCYRNGGLPGGTENVPGNSI